VPSRSHLTRPKPRNATVDLGDGDTINITFDANKKTQHWMREAQTRDEAQDSLSLPKALASVLIGWDVTEDDGSAFPPTPENIAVLSYPAQSEFLRRIIGVAVPSDAEGEASSALLSQALPEGHSDSMQQSDERAQMHPNGAATSTSPEHSASQSVT
jgi:hypothetical protein